MQKKNYLILFITIGVLVLGLLAYTLTNKLAHKKLVSYLEDNKSDLPIKSYDNLQVNVWKGYLHVNNIEFSIEDHSTASSFIKAKSISIEGFSLIKFWRNKKVKINQLEILEPEIYLIQNKTTVKDTIASPKKTNETPEISISEVSIKNATFSNNDESGDLLTKFRLVDASLNNLKIEDWKAPDTWYRNLESYRLEIEDLHHKASNWEVVDIEQIVLSHEEYQVYNLHFYTKLGIKEYNAQLPHERDHYNIKLPEVTVSPAIWDMQDSKPRILVSNIAISSPSLEIYRDKLLPDDTSYKPLFSQLLRELKFDMQTEEIKLNKADITYTERVKGQNDGGSVTFSELDAVITDAGNFKEVNEEKDLKIKVESNFMKTGRLTADWRFNPQDMDDTFHFEAKISHLDANRVNEFTEPNLYVRIEGKLDQVYINMYGNKNNSNTDFAISFHELKIDLLKDKGKKHRKLVSAVVNIFVRKGSDSKDRKLREERVEVERDTTKSIFNFIWKNTLEGLKATTLRL